MPAVEVFLDSNVVLYAMSGDPAERAKHDRASEIIATADLGISYQVLMEAWVTATRKFARPVPEDKVLDFLERLAVFPCVAGSPTLFRQAALIARQHQIHPFDAAIVAAAQELRAQILYTEDLNHGQTFGNVKIVNPFRDL